VTFVRGSQKRENRKEVISDEEMDELLRRAEQHTHPFFRLRNKALLCLLRMVGKRRSEIAAVELDDVKIEGDGLFVTFTLRKKRKRQVLTTRRTKQLRPLDSKYVKPIVEYYNFISSLNPRPKYLFPRCWWSPAFAWNGIFKIDGDKHISGRQVFNIVRQVSDSVWPHLFRETVAANVVRSDPSIIGVFKVQRRLDLEDYRTGFNYLRRYAADVISAEETQVDVVGSE